MTHTYEEVSEVLDRIIRDVSRKATEIGLAYQDASERADYIMETMDTEECGEDAPIFDDLPPEESKTFIRHRLLCSELPDIAQQLESIDPDYRPINILRIYGNTIVHDALEVFDKPVSVVERTVYQQFSKIAEFTFNYSNADVDVTITSSRYTLALTPFDAPFLAIMISVPILIGAELASQQNPLGLPIMLGTFIAAMTPLYKHVLPSIVSGNIPKSGMRLYVKPKNAEAAGQQEILEKALEEGPRFSAKRLSALQKQLGDTQCS